MPLKLWSGRTPFVLHNLPFGGSGSRRVVCLLVLSLDGPSEVGVGFFFFF